MFWDKPEYKAYEPQSFKETVTTITYTNPVNTCKHGVDDGACKECYQEVTHSAGLTDEEIMSVRTHPMTNIEFARAILRKASE